MNAEQRIEWLNERDPLHVWTANSDVFCLHCDGVFKAQDVASQYDEPTCPVCRTSGVRDFGELPWWREDLIAETETEHGFKRNWIGKPIQAVAGQPGRLPCEVGDPSLN